MKKYLFSIAAIAAAAFLLSSCEKEIVDNTTPVSSDTVTITFNASSTLSGSKTYIDGNNVKWADSGEVIRAFEVATPKAGDPVTASRYSSEGVTEDSGVTMTFGTTWPALSTEDYNSFDYYAFYPNSAYQSSANPNVSSVLINTPAAQTPTATSFDPAADLLIAKAKTGLTSQPSELTLQFARAIAVAKMTIKNLESTDPVTKITFSAKNGDTPVKLAGRTAYNLAEASLVSTYASNIAETSIVIDCSGINQTANTSAGTPVFFTCYPFTLNSTNPGSFKVVVETATQSFTKEVSVTSAKGLVLTAALPSIFAVDMDGIAGVGKAVDLCYASLDYSDYVAAGGTTSYSNVTVNKTHGDSWVTYAIATDETIGVRNNKNDNDSYIKLPDFVDDIETVVVTLKSVTADKTLTLESSATAKTGTIASETTTEDLVYTFDLSGDSYKTAYLRSNGAQAKVSKIEVYAGSDTRTPIAAPTNVAASLNSDDANVTNSIDVSWDAVDGAGSYVITLMDENTDLVIKEVASSPYTVTDLKYDMEYLIAVKAVPSDAYVNKESSETDAPNPVTTGAEPGGAKWVLVTNISGITAGDIYLLATNNQNNVYNGSISSGHLQVVGVTPTLGKIKDEDLPVGAARILFEAASGANKYYLKVGDNYISATAASSGKFKIDGETPFEWTFSDAAAGMNAVGTTVAAYIRSYNNNSFRSYASTSSGATFYLYKLNDPRTDTVLEWDETAPSATIGNGNVITFTQPTLTNVNGVDVTYSSSDEDVATVDNTGTVTILAAGQATISAVFAGNATYKPITVSYTITVTDARTPYDTPSFSPAAGEVASGTEVAILCTGADAIYYTTDGTTPSQTSTLYSSPISVTSTVTIKAIAYKDGRKPSAVASATYTVAADPNAQTTTLTNANIVAAGDASDSYASYSLTDGNSNTYSAYAIKKSHSKATSAYHFLQIKKYASSTAYYIQVPELGTKITSIRMTVSGSNQAMDSGGNTATLYFSASNSTSAAGAGVASGTGASSVTIDCSALNLNTGYITAGGAVRIWDIEITYTN